MGAGNKHARAMSPHPMPNLPGNVADVIIASTGNNPLITDAAYVLGQVCLYARVETDVVTEVLNVLVNAARSAPQHNFLKVANAVSHRIARDGETDVRRALVDEINESSLEHEAKSWRISDSMQGRRSSTPGSVAQPAAYNTSEPPALTIADMLALVQSGQLNNIMNMVQSGQLNPEA